MAAGVAIGLLAAAVASRTLAALLFGVDALDPVTMTIGPVAILATVAMACAVPAWRASRVDPILALRTD